MFRIVAEKRLSCNSADLAERRQNSATEDAIIWYSILPGDFQVANLL